MGAANANAITSGSDTHAEWLAVLGRREMPTDGVEDYCDSLAEALARRGIKLKKMRIGWAERGWLAAWQELRRQGESWRGRWVVLQYTALAWSRRGFPLGALAVAWILRRRGARMAVVFHEHCGVPSRGLVGKIRERFQNFVVRRLYRSAAKSIFTSPLRRIAWLPPRASRAAFIPIGANIPAPAVNGSRAGLAGRNSRTIAVFCVGDPPYRSREISDIAYAARSLASNGTELRVVFLGKGTAEAKDEIQRAFEGTGVEVSNLGVLSAEAVAGVLAKSDSMVCVRGALYPGRGSALAGVCCGIPIIGYAGACEGTPFAEAGVELVPYADREALAGAVARVLKDPQLWRDLHERSVRAQQKYFSWDVIAASFGEALGGGASP